jgi:DNA/RNA-binding domain of Phe-tRNA-synthetase-like protein
VTDDAADASGWLDRARVDDAVRGLRPDYAALLIVAEGLSPGPSDDATDTLLRDAEDHARIVLGGRDPADLPEVAGWRAAYRAFGARPNRTRPSVEALLRRVGAGLPRIDRITDVYNAISVRHLVPAGGEDLDHYRGAARLVRAVGDEPFDTTRDGLPDVGHPEPGEVVWRDDAGVTCRCWNWRQCTRTRITGATVRAVFVLDGLAAPGDAGALGESSARPVAAGLRDAGDDLTEALKALHPGARFAARLL